MLLPAIVSFLCLQIQSYPLLDRVEVFKREVTAGGMALGALVGATALGGMVAIPAMRSQAMLMNEQMVTLSNTVKSSVRQLTDDTSVVLRTSNDLMKEGQVSIAKANDLISGIKNSPTTVKDYVVNAPGKWLRTIVDKVKSEYKEMDDELNGLLKV
jgi:predicted PurR-regulated permease PerM